MTININPVIGHLGPFQFRWYGVIMAVAVIVGLWILSGQLKRRGILRDHAWGIALFAGLKSSLKGIGAVRTKRKRSPRAPLFPATAASICPRTRSST